MLSDAMFEGRAAIDEIIAGTDHYLTQDDGDVFGYGPAFQKMGDAVNAELLSARRKMTATQVVLDTEPLSVDAVATNGWPGAADRLIAARAMVERLTGESVADGFDFGATPRVVEAGHWTKLTTERGITDEALDGELLDPSI